MGAIFIKESLQRFSFISGLLNYSSVDIMPKQSLYFFIVFNLSFISQAFAQTSVPDTAIYRIAINNIIQLYTDSVKENLRLYNGTEFTGAYRSSAGHPFFEYAEPQQGDVFYDGIYYPGVLLSYDLIRDEIIFITPGKNLNIQLIEQKVNWFTIRDHLFLYIRDGDTTINFPGSGFYELIYEGAVSVFVKRKKQLYQSSKSDEISRFIQTNAYYVRKDNVYYTVNSKRSLLAVCKDHKSEIAKFIQKEGFNFKKDPASTMIKVIDYYTKLRN